jgi:hypothetical protein
MHFSSKMIDVGTLTNKHLSAFLTVNRLFGIEFMLLPTRNRTSLIVQFKVNFVLIGNSFKINKRSHLTKKSMQIFNKFK